MTRRGQLPGQQPAAFPDFSGKDRGTPISAEDRQAIRQAGLSAEQQQMAAQRQQAEEDRKDWHTDSLDVRRDIADQNAAFRAAVLATKGGGSKISPGQRAVEERN